MTIDLGRYQADKPYPSPRRISPDKPLARAMLQGYSGEVSELTTVLQYANHSLRCRQKFAEISGVLRGVFYVETIHMELLGECISRLGGSVAYNLSLEEKALCWQASLVEYGQTASEMLLRDIEGERQAVSFYRQMAALSDQPEITALMERLAEDELLHVQMFTALHRRYFHR